MTAPPPRRWFRFSLRTALIVLTIACFVAAWVGNRLNWIKQRQAARATVGRIHRPWITLGQAPGCLWMFGDDCEDVISVSCKQVDANEADRLKAIFPEAKIMFEDAKDATWDVKDWTRRNN